MNTADEELLTAATLKIRTLQEALSATEDKLWQADRKLIVCQRERDDYKTRSNNQYAKLREIRQLADAATGIDRSRNDPRESGALGAVKVLIARFDALSRPKP